MSDYCGGCENSEQHITECEGYESAEAFWNDKFHADSFTGSSCTLKISDLSGVAQNTFDSLFGTSNVQFDNTVRYRIVEISTDSNQLFHRKVVITEQILPMRFWFRSVKASSWIKQHCRKS